MIRGLFDRLRGKGRSATSLPPVIEVWTPGQRSMPGQAQEPQRFIFAHGPDVRSYLLDYALNAWVYTAVSELASTAAGAALEVWHRGKPKKAETHGLLVLLGASGRPNADEDLFEFLEKHFSNLLLAGNSYWFWYARHGGVPDAVYNLPPEEMLIEPGASDVVGHYVLRHQGVDTPLHKLSVTHFRKYHPFSRYYGLGALEALSIEIDSDRAMAEWNQQFFGDDQFGPAGILMVGPDVPDKELERLQDEMEAKHGKRRRTLIVRTQVGAGAWSDAALKHHELDFREGRLLSRQAVFEALGLPLGLYSESSTEAHARVAERLMLRTVGKLHKRTAIKLNQDALHFWPRHQSYEARFEDISSADWQQEKQRKDAASGVLTQDEMRERFWNLGPMPEAEKQENVGEVPGREPVEETEDV